MEHEDLPVGFECYPHAQNLGSEQPPREPTNAELDAPPRPGLWPGGPVPRKLNWVALAAVLAFYALVIALIFAAFPLDTWEFYIGG